MSNKSLKKKITADWILDKIEKLEKKNKHFFIINNDEKLTNEVNNIINWNLENRNKNRIILNKEEFNLDRYCPEIFEDKKLWNGMKEVNSKYNTANIPERTRLRFIKRVINRLIRFNVRQQIEYNVSVTQTINSIIDNIKKLSYGIITIQDNLESMINKILTKIEGLLEEKNQQEEIITRLASNVESINELNKNQDKKINKLINKIEQIDKQEEIIFRLSSKIEKIDQYYKEQDQKIMKLENEIEKIKKMKEIENLIKKVEDTKKEIKAYIDNNISSIREKINCEKNRIIENYKLNIENITDRQYMFQKITEERINNLNSKLSKDDSSRELLEKKLENLNNWVKLIDEKFEGLEKWLTLTNGRIDAYEKNYENIRKEIFYEIKNINNSRIMNNNDIKKITKIVREDEYNKKLELMKDNIKLNLGAGFISKEDYINIDLRELPGIDLISDVKELPYKKESISEIYAAHLIEHFTEMDLKKSILPHWYSLLKKGGKLRIVTPNIDEMIKRYNEKQVKFEDLREVIFGGQEYEYNYHYTMFNLNVIIKTLEDVGFKQIKVIEESRKNGKCLEMEIEAVK